MSCRQNQRRRVAWSSDFEPRLSTVTDETFGFEDSSTDATNSIQNSDPEQLRLREKNGDGFEVRSDDCEMGDISNPATPSAGHRERQDDEMILETATRDRRVLFFTELDHRVTPDVEMRDDSPCFSDRIGFDGRN